MNKYKFLFFDLDHTLWDFETNSIQTLKVLYDEVALDKKGIPTFENFNKVYHEINDVMWAQFRSGALSREDLKWKRMWQTLLHFKMPDMDLAKKMSAQYLDILPTQNALFPDTIEVLDYCKAKAYDIHLITNGFEKTQYQKLHHANLESYFGTMITSETAMSVKPQKEIFEFAMQQTGANVEQSIMIGDTLDADILGAQNVGMDQVYFNPKMLAHNQKPTFEIKSLSELKTIL
jgi:putative hydrolase of the HAD superfamily